MFYRISSIYNEGLELASVVK